MQRGDIVADMDNKFYVVSSTEGNSCSVYYLDFNNHRDTVIVKELHNQPLNMFDIADEMLVNQAGELNRVSTAVKNGEEIMVYT